MSESSTNSSSPRKTPWHLWVVSIVGLVWYGSGAYTIMMAQAGRLPDIGADEVAYYAAQALWFVILTNISLVAALAGSVALLLRSRTAVWLFPLSLLTIAITNIYDFAAGTSRMLVSQGALIVTGIIVAIAIFAVVYARAMSARAVLR